MRIYHSIEEYRQSEAGENALRSAASLGKFDGIHIGHARLIRLITDRARQDHLVSVVFAIEMKDGFILSHGERADYLESLGVDILVECPFSRQFRTMSAREFVRVVLADTLHAEYVCVGTDFAFGHNREGNASMLKELCRAHGCRADVVEKERVRDEDVSSTRVRLALEEGDMELVQELLGRPYPICGTVKHGRHLGAGIGSPTVNVFPQGEKILPPDGVYLSVTELPDHTARYGLTNLGMRPTVGGTTRRAETTLFEFNAELYGQTVTNHLLHFIRPERKFSGLDALKTQIEKDRVEAAGLIRSGSLCLPWRWSGCDL